MTGAREAALKTLYEVFYNGAYSNLALKETFSKCPDMSRADKNLLTNLVYGVVSRHFTLVYVIEKYSSIKYKKMSNYVRLILELGVYQLMYADKIPESAAVNESVKLAKKFAKHGSERFVNGVLRGISRNGCKFDYPQNKTEALAIKHSFSADMTKRFCDAFGYERADKMMSALNEAPSLMLRVNTLKTTADELIKKLAEQGINAEPAESSMISASGFDVGSNKLYKNGFFSVQDTAAYNAAVVLNPQKGETVIDMCAAPGGKTTHMAELMENTGRIIACDIHEHKTKLIENQAKRLGISCVEVRCTDSTEADISLKETADKVLCDVPCSGWGIIRRKPDIKLNKIEDDTLIPIQKAILNNGAEYVKNGGELMYSTCTVNPSENEGVTDEFLKAHPNFKKVYERTFYPGEDNTDGFYICKMIKL